jgi:hypothetical protein
LHRDPEAIAFTSPTNAAGLFDVEPESELLPFEGIGHRLAGGAAQGR